MIWIALIALAAYCFVRTRKPKRDTSFSLVDEHIHDLYEGEEHKEEIKTQKDQ